MGFIAALQALTAAGAFATRAFLPLFLLSLVARAPGLVTWLPGCPDPPVVLPAALAWLASDWGLALLGLLALAEILSDKSPDLRDVLSEAEAPLKAVAATVGALALADPDTRALLAHVAGQPHSAAGAAADLTTSWPHLAVAGLAGAGTFLLARWRRSGLRLVHDASDDLGLSRALSWLEDAWVLAGLVVLVAAPVLAIAGALALFALIVVGRHALEARAEAKRRPCPACGRRALPEAQACAGCRGALDPVSEPTARAWPDRWLALVRGTPPRERALELLARGRCPACAERRSAAELDAAAGCACGFPAAQALIEAPWRLALLRHVERRAHRLMLVTAIIGLVPIAGAATALVLARMRIAAPLRRALPLGPRFLARWTTRLLVAGILLLSGVPALSVLTGPIIVALTWRTWSRAFAAASSGQPAR